MAIVVIGGQSREIGKTSVAAGLISALPQYNWTAFKITQFGHGRCSLNGEPCACATYDRCWAITEEKDVSGESDSSRFLAAGAKRSYWVRTEQGRLGEAMPTLGRRMAESDNSILESNSILDFVKPDLYLSVLDASIGDFKPSAQRLLNRADAVILPVRNLSEARFPSHRRAFYIAPPEYVTAELIEFVCERLQNAVAR